MINSTIRNLATALILYEKIDTTEDRAKQVKPYLEHLFGLAVNHRLRDRRELKRRLFHPNAVRKVFDIMVPNLKVHSLRSGFFQVYRLGPRSGDGANKVRLIIDPRLTQPPTANPTS